MPSNEKNDRREKKRHVYRGTSREDFSIADREHVTYFSGKYGEFVLSWYMGENTEKPACVADPFAANVCRVRSLRELNRNLVEESVGLLKRAVLRVRSPHN